MKIISGRSQRSQAIIYILLSGASFSLMNLFVRLSGDLPTFEKCFFRNAIAVLVVLFTLTRGETLTLGGRQNIKPLAMRSIFGSISLMCNFYSIDHTLISNASMFNKLSPFAALIASYFLLKEKIKPHQAFCIIIAFIGALFIIKPSTDFFATYPSLIGFIGGIGAGIAYTFVRICRLNGVSGPLIILVFSLSSCILSVFLMIKDFVIPSPGQMFFLILTGCAAAAGQFNITAAYSRAPAKTLAVYEYGQIIFSAILGFLFLAEIPDKYSFLGYAIIIGAAILMYCLPDKSETSNQAP